MQLAKLALILIYCISFNANAQLRRDIFPLNKRYAALGWYIAPEINYSFPLGEQELTGDPKNPRLPLMANAEGKLGYGGELGLYYAFRESRLIHFLEFGIAFRFWKGAVLQDPVAPVYDNRHQTFDIQMIPASIRASNAKQLGKNTLVYNSIGITGNYFLREKFRGPPLHWVDEYYYSDNPTLQLTYSFGIGMRLTEHTIFIPSLETSIVQLFPNEKFRTGFEFYGGQFQPIILKLRFLILRDDPINCNAPTYNGPLGL